MCWYGLTKESAYALKWTRAHREKFNKNASEDPKAKESVKLCGENAQIQTTIMQKTAEFDQKIRTNERKRNAMDSQVADDQESNKRQKK